MRWFKHMTLSSQDERLSELLDEHGAEGYGVWWLILEKTALTMDGSGKCFARYSVKNWSKSCRVSVKKFQTIVAFLSKLESFSVKKEEKYITIECRNLLKYRDEWSKKQSKNSGVTPEQLRSKRQRQRQRQSIEIDKKEKKKKKPLSPVKINYAEFVQMTEAENSRLVEKYGKDKTVRFIEKLDNHKGAEGKKYESDYRAILKWVVSAIEREAESEKNGFYPNSKKNGASGRTACGGVRGAGEFDKIKPLNWQEIARGEEK